MGTADNDLGSPWDFRPDGTRTRTLVVSLELPPISEAAAAQIKNALEEDFSDASARAAILQAWGPPGARLWDAMPALDQAAAPGRVGGYAPLRLRAKQALKMMP